MDRRNKHPKQLSAERRQVLLEVAGDVFRDKGFGGCSIDHIARQSGVSKSTIYRQFENKDAIFEAVQLHVAQQQASLVNDFVLDKHYPAQSLQAFARHIYHIDTRPKFLESFRLLLAIAGRMPEMAERIRAQGTTDVLQRLTTFFQQLIESNAMIHPSSRQAAVTFYVLARGNFRPLLGASANLDAEINSMNIDITIFLKGIGLLPATLAP